jgi:hypothetical protein
MALPRSDGAVFGAPLLELIEGDYNSAQRKL